MAKKPKQSLKDLKKVVAESDMSIEIAGYVAELEQELLPEMKEAEELALDLKSNNDARDKCWEFAEKFYSTLNEWEASDNGYGKAMAIIAEEEDRMNNTRNYGDWWVPRTPKSGIGWKKHAAACSKVARIRKGLFEGLAKKMNIPNPEEVLNFVKTEKSDYRATQKGQNQSAEKPKEK